MENKQKINFFEKFQRQHLQTSKVLMWTAFEIGSVSTCIMGNLHFNNDIYFQMRSDHLVERI